MPAMHEIDYKVYRLHRRVSTFGGLQHPDGRRDQSALFGGEGLFFATLRGPGRIWLQSLPLSRLAGRITAASPKTGSGGREEGSILGGIGRLLDGGNS